MATVLDDANSSPVSVGIWAITPAGDPVLDATLPVAGTYVSYLSKTVLLTAAGNGPALLWDLADPRRPVRGAVLGGDVTQWVSSAGSLVGLQGSDGRMHVWRVTSARDARELGSFADPGVGAGEALMMPTGKEVTALTARGIEWWDIADPARPVSACLTRLENVNQGGSYANGDVQAVVGPQGPTGSPLDLFDVSGGRPRPPVELTNNAGSTLTVSADGRLLAATGADNNNVLLWDVSNPRHPRPLPPLTTETFVTGIAISPGDDQLAVWNATGTLQLWDITSPAEPVLTATVTLAGQGGTAPSVGDALYVPGTQRLLLSADGSVYVLDASPAHLASTLCSYTGATITPAQAEFAPGVPDQNPCGQP